MRRLRRRCGALVLSAATACGYSSSYVPPDNHRARPRYDGDQVVMMGPGALPKCSWEVSGAPPAGPPPPLMAIDDRGYWSSGVSVYVVHVGPMPPHWYVLPPGVPPSPSGVAAHSLLGGTFSGGGGGGGGDKGAGMVLVIIAAVAVVASVGVAIGLAADPPEGSVAEGIDQVNQYNDAARRKIAECVAQPVRPLAAPPAVPGGAP